MIRKEVEKLRGLVLTPEELEDVILPLVVAAKGRKRMVTNKDWDFIAKINDTDLYGLLNILLKELGEEGNVTDSLNNIKSAFNECLQEENDERDSNEAECYNK